MGVLFGVVTVGLGLLLAASPWTYDFETHRVASAAAVVYGAVAVMVGALQIFEERAERESHSSSRSDSQRALPFRPGVSLRDRSGQRLCDEIDSRDPLYATRSHAREARPGQLLERHRGRVGRTSARDR